MSCKYGHELPQTTKCICTTLYVVSVSHTFVKIKIEDMDRICCLENCFPLIYRIMLNKCSVHKVKQSYRYLSLSDLFNKAATNKTPC